MKRSGFESVNAVVQHQNSLIEQVGYKSKNHKVRWTAGEILKREKSRLINLRNKLYSEEQNLLKQVGITSLEDFLNRVEAWNGSGAEVLLNDGGRIFNLINPILKEIGMEKFKQNFDKALNEEGNQIGALFARNDIDPKSPDSIYNDIISELNSGLGESNNVTSKHGSRRFTGALKKHMTIIIPETDKKKIHVEFKDSLSIYYQNRLTERFNMMANNSFADIKDVAKDPELRQKVKDIVLSGINGEASFWIEKALNDFFVNKWQINVNANIAVIKGFLGEVYWTAFWRYVTNDNATIKATGMITAQGTGAEIPIDIIINGIGLQVKNYDISDGGVHRLDKSLSLQEFVKGRLEMPVNAFENFFFSYGYNKVADDADIFPNAETVYGPVFERFEKILKFLSNEGGLKTLAEDRLDRVIKIDSEFTTSEEEIFRPITGQLKANTLFLINRHPIFSSDMVQSIIEGFNSGDIEIQLENFDLDYSEPDISPYWEDTAIYDDIKNTTSITDAIKTAQVSYTVMIDVGRLVERVKTRNLGSFPNITI